MYRSETAPKETDHILRPDRSGDTSIHAASIASSAYSVILYADNEVIEVFPDYDEARNASAKYGQFKSGLMTANEWRTQYLGEWYSAEDTSAEEKN